MNGVDRGMMIKNSTNTPEPWRTGGAPPLVDTSVRGFWSLDAHGQSAPEACESHPLTFKIEKSSLSKVQQRQALDLESSAASLSDADKKQMRMRSEAAIEDARRAHLARYPVPPRYHQHEDVVVFSKDQESSGGIPMSLRLMTYRLQVGEMTSIERTCEPFDLRTLLFVGQILGSGCCLEGCSRPAGGLILGSSSGWCNSSMGQ